MRFSRFCLIASLLIMVEPLPASENAAVAAPRTVDYEWMSVATWEQKHEANVLRASKGDADILLLGDSITEGWQNTSLWPDHYPNAKIANFGVGGDTTANLLWRLENGELGTLKPRVIVLLIGINNLGRNGDKPAEVVLGIRTIVGILNSRLPNTKILVVGILPSDQAPKTGMRKRISKTNEMLKKQLHDGHSVFVEDIGTSVLEADGTIASETMEDFLHPTPAGYARMAAALFPKVDRLLPKK